MTIRKTLGEKIFGLRSFLFLTGLFFFLCAPCDALYEPAEGEMVFENEEIRAVVSPVGGRIVSLFWKEEGVEFTSPGADYTGGMAKERILGADEWTFAKAVFEVKEGNPKNMLNFWWKPEMILNRAKH